MAAERDEYYLNEDADFDVRWRKGLLAAGFSEEDIEAGVDWSDPRLKQVDLGSDVSGAELEKARTRIVLQSASDELVDMTVQAPWERQRQETSDDSDVTATEMLERSHRRGIYSKYVPIPAHTFIRMKSQAFREAMFGKKSSGGDNA